MRVFFEKTIEKKHLYRHYKNYYYFWKSNIPVINLIVDSKNSFKKYEFVKNKINGESCFQQIPTISQRFLLFLNGAEFWKARWINEVKCNAKLRRS